MSDGTELVLRADFGEDRIDRFQRIVNRHRAAAQGVEAVAGVNVPKIIWQHPTRHFTVMEFAPGETAFRELDLSDFGLANRAQTLQRIGQAVAELHACSKTEQREFWPKHNLNRVADRARDVRSGVLGMRKKAKFLGLCAYLHRAGRRARGVSFAGAIEHGDLHLRNILMTEDTVSFIDFANDRNAVPQNDIANLWLANCPDHLAQAGQKVGYGQVAEADWAAFFSGYGQDFRLDPVFQFCFAMRLFSVWRRLPAPMDPVDPRAQAMINGVVSVFNWLIENEPD
ncbi:phosphotransferase [Epibacterium ulvae]|uniref:phosphotransferase n=1 Tax=Epibacterium ulvae TaxID=1156985 RepID=UPI001BFC4E73|nr:phosphotransferase [Epibacterium ulvae]MBT8153330.1 phosphotransferase [Epibacterium ulvae]